MKVLNLIYPVLYSRCSFPCGVLPWPVDEVQVNIVQLEIANRVQDSYMYAKMNAVVNTQLFQWVRLVLSY